MYTRFCPKSLPRKAVRGMTTTFAMMYPVLIQVISCTVAPSDPIMCGSATATIDESMAPMSVPKVIDTVTSHLLGLGRAARPRRNGADPSARGEELELEA